MALIGSLREVDVVGLVELARQASGRARLQINSGDHKFILYLADGEIVHAENGAQTGVAVVYVALECTDGMFELERGGPPPPKITIDLSWNTLLLQGLQRLDEARHANSLPQPLEEDSIMAAKEKLEDILKEMATDMEPGLRGIGVAGTDGLGIAFHKVGGEAAEGLGAQMALILQLSRRSTERLEKSAVEDVLVTSEKSYLLGRFLGDGTYFMVVSVDRDSVLGNVRLSMRNYSERMLKAIPGAK